MNASGKLITLEGPDGVGKSTQIAHLASWLRGEGYTVLVSKEPGKAFNGQLRQLILGGEATALAQFFMFCADRHQHVETIVKPALARGEVVLLDRFIDSTVAYQWFGHGGEDGPVGAAFDHVYAFEKTAWAAAGNLAPDLTLVLDVPPDVAFARLAKRGEVVRIAEKAGIEFFERARAYFTQVLPGTRVGVQVINADQAEDAVFYDIKSAYFECFAQTGWEAEYRSA